MGGDHLAGACLGAAVVVVAEGRLSPGSLAALASDRLGRAAGARARGSRDTVVCAGHTRIEHFRSEEKMDVDVAWHVACVALAAGHTTDQK